MSDEDTEKIEKPEGKVSSGNKIAYFHTVKSISGQEHCPRWTNYDVRWYGVDLRTIWLNLPLTALIIFGIDTDENYKEITKERRMQRKQDDQA